jgi:hypothetical protein
MKLSAKNPVPKSEKTIKVIKNAHTVAEQRAIGDRWAEHKGPRMTLSDVLAYAENQEKTEKVAH